MKFLKQFSAVLLLGLSLCVAADRGPVAPFQANEKSPSSETALLTAGFIFMNFNSLKRSAIPMRRFGF